MSNKTTTSPPSLAPTAVDTALAKDLNLPAVALAQLRVESLECGVHWTEKPKVAYTERGRARVMDLMGMTQSEVEAPISSFLHSSVPPSRAFTVWMESEAEPEVQSEILHPKSSMQPLRILFRLKSRIWVRVLTPAGDGADVRVRNNKRLRPGVLLQCELRESQWHCVHQGFAPL